MAIQFNCPQCSAPIRVPDTAAGKKGSCPKCSSPVIVPHVDAPPAGKAKPASPPPPDPPSAPEEPAVAFPDVTKRKVVKKVIKKVKKVVKKVPASVPTGEPTSEVVEESSVPSAEIPSLAAMSAEPDLPVPEKTVAHKKISRRRKRKSSMTTFVIPAICLLLLLGGIGWYVWKLQKESAITRDIKATVVINPPVYAVELAKAEIDLSASKRDEALTGLEAQPLQILEQTMNNMEVTISGTEKGLKIQVDQLGGGDWYRIDFSTEDDLLDYVRENLSGWEDLRRDKLDESLQELLPKWNQAQTDGALTLAFRNDLAFSATVGAVGFLIEAIEDTPEGLRAHRCVYEDKQGRLYFLMPRDLKSFTVQGRELDDGSRPFQAKLYVTVADEPEQDLKKPANAAPGDPEYNEDDERPTLSEIRENKKKDEDEDPPGLGEMRKDE